MHDTIFKDHKHHILPPADEKATSRVFVPEKGMKRAYTFKKGESRELTEERLEQQLCRFETGHGFSTCGIAGTVTDRGSRHAPI